MSVNYKKVVEKARAAFCSGHTLSVEFRRQQLKQLKLMYTENMDIFVDALRSDLHKPYMEAKVMEVHGSLENVKYMLRRLDKWTAEEQVASIIPLDRSHVQREPYGVALVMGAWNYPLILTMEPVHGALAAGNTVIIKPSELSPATAAALAKLIPQYLDKECYQVVCGGVAETTELLKERFDYIFYTGSNTVGRIVREAANRHLTPTTLELGGKSPCYIDHTVNLDQAVRRIMWGKLINLGQTCVAPDYLLCSRAVGERVVAKVREVVREWYGPNPKTSPDLGRIVAERHVDRLVSYLESGRVAVGGHYDRSEKWMEPTILVDVPEDSKVMQEEIFGPILPILTVDNHVQAIDIIRRKEKPLTMYVFSREEEVQQLFLQQVQCGGVCLNDTILHITNGNLPFGGVGSSGMGSYHGRFTFETFSHHKAVLSRSYNSFIDKATRNRFPPYTAEKTKFMLSQKDSGDGPGLIHYARTTFVHLVSMAAGAILLYLSLHYSHTGQGVEVDVAL